MNLLAIGLAGYLIAFVVNILLFRANVGGLGGWLAMLADPRHGRLLNIVALIVLFLPPIVYLILLCQLYGFVQEKVKK
ncbi:MAG: hypothetical protein COV30_02050 [Candidatus Yanofskybacteria bacterium CG10_big_fil_rev_8_21_14_0_10_37_15]|uniref:Uncharacterized protein n=1 Tax=Candidatus Yanofskybacteria bacterium CG10_big_fil_rev_8_21_14_0_10_37_15 TaxID=1975097 RepID=A0A2H0R5D8_9BACT|nr:MAG: hypothetical protein COV30_02050 [Candidatus Yanofskybacteria bacterium CG10_big_fil_rev_8_21_14_0_10_37_15]